MKHLILVLIVLAICSVSFTQDTWVLTPQSTNVWEDFQITAISDVVKIETETDTLILNSGQAVYYKKELRFTFTGEALFVGYKDGKVCQVWVSKEDAPLLQYLFYFQH